MKPKHSIPFLRSWVSALGDCRSGKLLGALVLAALLLAPGSVAHAATLKAPVATSTGSFTNAQVTYFTASPTITGTAQAAGPLRLLIVRVQPQGKKEKAYEAANVSVVDGGWSRYIYPPIPAGAYEAGLYAGPLALASTTFTIGVRSAPSLELITLPLFDVADGVLQRFKIHAGMGGPVGIGKITFKISATSADVSQATLVGYSDSAYTLPLATSTYPNGVLNGTPVDLTGDTLGILPDTPVEIPAGETYYFELDASVSPNDSVYSVETTLLGDSTEATTTAALADRAADNVAWSPNTYGTSSPADADWLNASLLPSLPARGLVQVRVNAPGVPTCSMDSDTSTISANQPVTITWSGTGTDYTLWDDGKRDAPSGSRVFTNVSATRTFILKFFGPQGSTNCFVTVGVPKPVVVTPPATTTAQTASSTSVLNGFVATPLSGTAPLLVSVTGTVNASSSCAAATYTFSYGDASTTQIAVTKNLCKPLAFSMTHTYSKTGTFTAGLYKGAFSGFATGTAQLVQKQLITVSKKVADAAPQSNTASVFEAVKALGGSLLDYLRRFFGW